MRLETLHLKNFRSCYDTRIDLGTHLTLLVGENDAGKSNIIEAIRRAIPPASARPSAWFDADRDLSFGVAMGSEIEVSRTYADMTQQEDAFYAPALVDAHRKLIHTTVFRTDPLVARRHRLTTTVGDHRIPDPEPESRDRIAHVYLPPLRDATRALDSADGNRLAEVFELIIPPSELELFAATANEKLGELADSDVASRVVGSIQTHLTSLTEPVRHRVVGVRHRNQRLRRLTAALRLHMAAAGLTPSDLMGSGLGYANLLYIATVVLEIERASEFDLLLLLVEEPEAHLHPQLQTVLLSYLGEQAEKSAQQPPAFAGPSGRIQVIASSHSPQLVCARSTRDVVVIRSQERTRTSRPEEDDRDEEITEEAPPRYMETLAVPLAAIPMDDPERRKVDRYLDATRAALLFTRQVVLVEGIAEALLLRTFAERLVFPEARDEADGTNRRLREQFRAILVLPIDGVDFLPYLKVLLGGTTPLVDRVVVLTDGDNGAGGRRRDEIAQTFSEHMEAGRCHVCIGETTLEAELYAVPGNEAILRDAFAAQHPRSLERWDGLMANAPADQRSVIFAAALRDKSLDLGKGDFAHLISDAIQTGATAFVVPAYIATAIEAVVIRQ